MGSVKNQEVLQQVLLKAWDDAEFKKELIANPKKAIKDLTGEDIEIPEGKELITVDRTDDSKVYLDIPKKETFINDVELTDEQLEAAAGGAQGPIKDFIGAVSIMHSCVCEQGGYGIEF